MQTVLYVNRPTEITFLLKVALTLHTARNLVSDVTFTIWESSPTLALEIANRTEVHFRGNCYQDSV
jgi:hypothetical protein